MSGERIADNSGPTPRLEGPRQTSEKHAAADSRSTPRLEGPQTKSLQGLPSAPTFFGSQLKKSIVHLAAMAIGASIGYFYPSDGAKTVNMGANPKTGLTAADEASRAKQKTSNGESQKERRDAALKKGEALLEAAKKSPETRPENTTFAKATDPAAIRRNNVAQAAVESANSTGGHKQGSPDAALAGAGGGLALTALASLMMRRRQSKAFTEAKLDYNFTTDTNGLGGKLFGRTLEETKNNIELRGLHGEAESSLRHAFAKHQAEQSALKSDVPFEYKGTQILDERGLKEAIEKDKGETWGRMLPEVWFPWRHTGGNSRLPSLNTEVPKSNTVKETTDLKTGEVKSEAEIEKARQLLPSPRHGSSNGENFTTPKPVRWWHLS